MKSNQADKQPSAVEQARLEVAQETRKEDVAKVKRLLIQERDAQTVLKNIQREIADLEEAIEQGNA